MVLFFGPKNKFLHKNTKADRENFINSSMINKINHYDKQTAVYQEYRYRWGWNEYPSPYGYGY